MTATPKKYLLASGLAAALLSATPSESKAIFHWLRNCCGTPAAAPVVAPAVAAVPSCNPCQQTVAYVPQTSYRVQYVSVPVTTYRPVTSCSLCGPTTTYMQPVTTYQTQAQFAPYTSYRLVYSAALPVATTVNYAPAAPAACCAPAATSVAYPAAPAASCCAPTATTANYAPGYVTAPAAVVAPAPILGAVVSTPAAPAPTYQSAPAATYQAAPAPVPTPATPSLPASGGPQSTYAPNTSGYGAAPAPQSPTGDGRLQPIPDARNDQPPTTIVPNTTVQPNSGPALGAPDSHTTQTRDTQRWAYNAVAPIQPVSQVVARPVVDDGGWRPAR